MASLSGFFAVMLPVLATLLSVSVQITSADIDLSVTGGGARVRVEYRFAAEVDEVVVQAIQLAGQDLVVITASVELSAQRRSGLTEWRGVTDGGLVSVDYRVDGAASRIPLLIPTATTIPGETQVRIVIRGLSIDVPLADGFPRMTRNQDGTISSVPANLPSFVLLPELRRVSVAVVADAVVLGAIVLLSVVWIARRRVRITP